MVFDLLAIIAFAAGLPSAPQNVQAYADPEGWLVKWQLPATDGGESIQSFVIDFRSEK